MKVALKLLAYVLLTGLLCWSLQGFRRVYSEASMHHLRRLDTEEQAAEETNNQVSLAPTTQTDHINALSRRLDGALAQSELVKTNPIATAGTNRTGLHTKQTAITNAAATNALVGGLGTDIASQEDLTSNTTEMQKQRQPKSSHYGLGTYGFVGVLSLLCLAILIANDVSTFIEERVRRFITDEDKLAKADETYEKAEQAWARGDHIEAINLLREYLKRHPRHLHAKFRIAEIYENDLNNPVAAALEYEEILSYKFDAERWAWAAIHLCNLYNRIGQTDKAIQLLRRIVQEYGQTAPAEKARQRLAMLGEHVEPVGRTTDIPSSKANTTGDEVQRHQLPKGFRPKR